MPETTPPIEQAVILAAGYAMRMRPLTDTMPKPMLRLGDRPLIHHIVDKLAAAGVLRIVLTGHHCLDVLAAYVPVLQRAYPDVDFVLSTEQAILETGGGTVQACRFLDLARPFYLVNGDSYWTDGLTGSMLGRLQSLWRDHDGSCDMVLALIPLEAVIFGERVGDYVLSGTVPERRRDRAGTHMFIGIRIVHPRALAGRAVEPFSFLEIMDAAEAAGRLRAVSHDGAWYHISTPDDLRRAGAMLGEPPAGQAVS